MTRNFLGLLLISSLAGLLASGCIFGSDKSPCDDVDCGLNATCVEIDGEAVCQCNEGYHVQGDECVLDGYDVAFDWVFGEEEKTCSQVLITQVHVVLLDASETATHDNVVDCSTGGAILEDVQDGTHTLELTGLTNSGEEYYFYSGSVTVDGQDVDLGIVVLEAIGYMKFAWTFGPGQDDCETVGVDRVKVMIYDETGTTEMYTANPVPYCSDGGHEIGSFYLDIYTLILEGKCESDTEVHYRYENTFELVYPGENDFGSINLEEQPNGPCF